MNLCKWMLQTDATEVADAIPHLGGAANRSLIHD